MTDYLYLEWGDAEVLGLRVFSIEGMEIAVHEKPMSGMRLSTSNWSPGMYLVRIKDTRGKEWVRRVVRK